MYNGFMGLTDMYKNYLYMDDSLAQKGNRCASVYVVVPLLMYNGFMGLTDMYKNYLYMDDSLAQKGNRCASV